uniref:Putative lysophospholipase n=1 Tax=uncultured bacterium contig00002 TaxID=1181494 RepID=A0A806JYA5_9BACT|nr:putative lysophospholipase [uncultured bacterium contig00002]
MLKADKIFHDRISLRLYAEITAAGEYAIKNAARITIPTLLLCAGSDKIVSVNAMREFCINAKENVTMLEYPDAYHCLRSDTGGNEVEEAMLDFIRSQQ